MKQEAEMTLYMKVTRDEYELPVAVADTKNELARMLGIERGKVRSAFAKVKKYGYKHSTYVVVEVDDD